MVKIQANSNGQIYMTSNGKVLLSKPAPSGSGLYQLFDRIRDDGGNEIGTVSGFFTDANDIEYAVVCLDAQYRYNEDFSQEYSGGVTAMPFAYWTPEALEDFALQEQYPFPNLPIYSGWNIFNAGETATDNTTEILASTTVISPMATHCQSKTFYINGVEYAGQIPNMHELVDIFVKNADTLDLLDTSIQDYHPQSLGYLMNENEYDLSVTSSSVVSWDYENGGMWGMHPLSMNEFIDYQMYMPSWEISDGRYVPIPVLEIPNQ